MVIVVIAFGESSLRLCAVMIPFELSVARRSLSERPHHGQSTRRTVRTSSTTDETYLPSAKPQCPGNVFLPRTERSFIHREGASYKGKHVTLWFRFPEQTAHCLTWSGPQMDRDKLGKCCKPFVLCNVSSTMRNLDGMKMWDRDEDVLSNRITRTNEI